jgi:hypothetical protein
MGSAGISDDTTTIGGAGDVLSARLDPLRRSEGRAEPAAYEEEEEPGLPIVCEVSAEPVRGNDVLDEEGEDALPLLIFFSEP